MLFQIQTWLALKTKKSRKENKPTDEGMEEDVVRELINDCDELINDLESDLSLLSRRRKRSKRNKEVRKRIHECDDLIKELESDLSLVKRVELDVRKQLISACDDLINDLEPDLRSFKTKKLRVKKKHTDEGGDVDSEVRKQLIRAYDDLIKDLESDLKSLNTKKLRKKEKKQKRKCQSKHIKELLKECNILIKEIGNDISRNLQKPRKVKRKKKERDISKIKDEVLNIVSINARGVARKKKSIEEILKNESVDIAIISELSVKTSLKLKGYREFIEIRGHMHGICILVRNDIAKHALRIHNESELEVVHVRLSNTVPALNIIGTYLSVESRVKADDTKKTWNNYTEIVQQVLDRGEACVCMGDFNRPLQAKKPTLGTKLLDEWIEGGTMKLINDRKVNTRLDPGRGTGSVLDLAIISANIEKSVTHFKVDSERKMTAFAMLKRKNKTIDKRFTDHFTINLKLKIPTRTFTKGKKRKIINMNNKEGWLLYPEITDKYASKMVNAVQDTEDADELEKKLDSIDKEIQIEAFGYIYVKERSKPKKIKKKGYKDLNSMYTEYLDEVDAAITECLDRKDINSRMYKLKTLINGPKIKPQEQAAINDPKTNILITDKEQIKKVSLEHNVEILTKMKPLPQYEYIIKEKQDSHEKMMERNQEEDMWSLDLSFYYKVTKRIKDKNKNMFFLFNKAGPKYKAALFMLMKRFIEKEEIPKAYDLTSLTQIWKKKGSALSLNNMRFIHMKCWRAKLLEALITEKMKPQIVEATPKIQIGGMPSSQSVEHLVTLKSWMKQIEDNDLDGIVSLYDMSKFFDKESLLDCMDTLNKKAKVDAKSYRMLYKLNENTKISVKTSVGESETAPIKDSVGQGSFAAALVSSLNIGSAIADKFKGESSANIGMLELICLILQDDIMKMSNTVEQARDGSQKIDELLKQKLLSLNYDKSKYILLGNRKAKNRMKKELRKQPMKMGEEILENSVMEKYLGDIIHEKGCEESITATIKERMRKLTPKCEEIIQIANSSIMGGLRNSNIAFKLFEALVIQPLLHNCASWIGITEKHIKELQKFQNKFVRRVLHLPHSVTQAILDWDVGVWPMGWRIKERKLNFVRQILLKDNENIAKQTLQQEMATGLNGLAHECNNICNEIDIPEVTNNNVLSKRQIKSQIQEAITEQNKNNMQSFRKVSDRMSDDPLGTNYLDRMGLTHSRIWIRYRARAIKGIKANHKRSWKSDLKCRFCDDNILETQEHLEECRGLSWERRNLRMDTEGGKINFFKRLEKKLG